MIMLGIRDISTTKAFFKSFSLEIKITEKNILFLTSSYIFLYLAK